MNKIINNIFKLLFIVSFFTIGFIWGTKETSDKYEERINNYKKDTIYINSNITEWDLFIISLIEVESNNNPNAVNKKTKAYGLYQILPKGGYLDEFNRLNKNKQYSYNDLKNVNVQHEIFNFIVKTKNPNKDIDIQIKIHNKNGGKIYKDKIYLKMNKKREHYGV